ncbi:hypothetical protein Ngar_c13630 [Candidatus Nitrososphaera gargensis Ga9.2]|uniref:Uncharacterized protein n=1 Tax=Nitrososphaera gargensis (strain Ga9.2) TaxID=1237085 RepID=K0IAG0_NITGG|nr:LuxR C-terminal-related transcriptional regulator [Candidatus Nitrososphaera gargensis]AFU58301.1 hypothetical protein Ngar_c13630 [Candidatus Nitrososphaera gargensis Ga9.2]
MSSKKKKLENDLIEWRRSQVLSMLATGLSQTEIADMLKVAVSTVNKDIKKIRLEAKAKQQDYIDNELPFQHKLAVASLDKVLEEAWQIFRTEKAVKARLAALEIIADSTMKKQAVLGDPAQIEKAIKLVNRLRKQISSTGQAQLEEGSGHQQQLEEEQEEAEL